MNNTLRQFARQQLIDGLAKLPDDWQTTFKLMYGRKNGLRSVYAAKTMSIEDVVSEISDDKLDWAMMQVENSVAKLAKQEL